VGIEQVDDRCGAGAQGRARQATLFSHDAVFVGSFEGGVGCDDARRAILHRRVGQSA